MPLLHSVMSLLVCGALSPLGSLATSGGIAAPSVDIHAVDTLVADFLTGPATLERAAGTTAALGAIVDSLAQSETASDTALRDVGAAVRAAVRDVAEAMLAEQVHTSASSPLPPSFSPWEPAASSPLSAPHLARPMRRRRTRLRCS